MLRPPALQLKFDNRFPLPVKSPKSSKPTSSFVSQLYKANWKNPIIAVAGLNTLRFAFAAYNAFRDAALDDLEEADNLFMVSLALGAMYIIASVIEIYGVISVSMQRLNLIRLYLYFSLLACFLVISAGVLNGISYLTFAEELVWECVARATDDHDYQNSLFRGQLWPISGSRLTVHDAHQQCVYAWVHQSWFQVTSVFLFSVFPAAIYYILVYAYYRQTVNRNHSACLMNTHGDDRSNHHTAQAYSQVGYTRVVGKDNDISQRNDNHHVSSRGSGRLEYDPSRRRIAQASKSLRKVGVRDDSPVNKKPPFVSKSLKRNRRPPPLIPSPSPLGFSPGPPSYGPSKVYAAFAGPVPS